MSEKKIKVDGSAGQLGFVLFTSYIGALVYFINQADGILHILFAFIQAVFLACVLSVLWPCRVWGIRS